MSKPTSKSSKQKKRPSPSLADVDGDRRPSKSVRMGGLNGDAANALSSLAGGGTGGTADDILRAVLRVEARRRLQPMRRC